MKLVGLVLILAFISSAQEKPEKFAIYLSGEEGPAALVVKSLTKLMNASKPFEVVGPKDPLKLAVLISCMDKPTAEVPFVCMYVSQYNGAAFKTFMGGGLSVFKNVEDVANQFLGAIAQDVVERYNDTDKQNLRQGLEACLFLTDSKCNVPNPLQKELDAKQLSLGQYLMIQHQNGKQ